MEEHVPFTRGLFQPIDALEEVHDSRRSILCPFELAHVNPLLEVCVEKRTFDVCRVHVHVPLGRDGQDCTHGAELGEWRESSPRSRLLLID
jgi:hypothetical protein